jgi:hypothetical protein
MTRPSPELDGGDDNGPIAKVKNKTGTIANYFFWKSEKRSSDEAQRNPGLSLRRGFRDFASPCPA